MGIVNASMTRNARFSVLRKPSMSSRANISEMVGSNTIAMAVPIRVSGTCMMNQP